MFQLTSFSSKGTVEFILFYHMQSQSPLRIQDYQAWRASFCSCRLTERVSDIALSLKKAQSAMVPSRAHLPLFANGFQDWCADATALQVWKAHFPSQHVQKISVMWCCSRALPTSSEVTLGKCHRLSATELWRSSRFRYMTLSPIDTLSSAEQ
jgi:hypothetical protein